MRALSPSIDCSLTSLVRNHPGCVIAVSSGTIIACSRQARQLLALDGQPSVERTLISDHLQADANDISDVLCADLTAVGYCKVQASVVSNDSAGKIDLTAIASWHQPGYNLVFLENAIRDDADCNKDCVRSDSAGITQEIYAVADASAMEKAQKQLRASEQQFKAVFDNAAVGIIVTDLNANIELCNKSFQSLVGYSHDEIVGQNSDSFTYSEDIDVTRNMLGEMNRSGLDDYYQMQKRYVHKQGGIVWARLSATTLKDADGNPRHVIAIVEDITARKEAERQLAESYKFVEAVVAKAGEGIVVLDSDMKVKSWNRFMEKLTNIPESKAIGENVQELPPYVSGCSIGTDLKRVLAGDTVIIREIPLDQGNSQQQKKYVTISYVPHTNSEKDIIGIIQTVHDVTNRKLAVDELLKANKDLHDAYLTQREFLNNVTHEVRTPLTAVQGYCEMLTEEIFGPINAEQSEMIRRIMFSSTQLLDIVNSILEMTRLNCGVPMVRLKVLDPGLLLKHVLDSASALASRKAIDISIHDNSEHRLGLYDEQKLLVVLSNIITNAVKFTDHGNIDIYLDIRDFGTTIIVADTGIGIKSSQLQSIFEEFHQLDIPGKHKPSGFGLGLSIVAATLDAMNAQLVVSSVKNVGTAFTIYVPVGELEGSRI